MSCLNQASQRFHSVLCFFFFFFFGGKQKENKKGRKKANQNNVFCFFQVEENEFVGSTRAGDHQLVYLLRG
jgi:hypothetical protein